MLSKEIKQLLELSGGKIIISEGELEKSYVIMKLGDYLRESLKKKCNGQEGQALVPEEINVEVESLRQNELEEELTIREKEEFGKNKETEMEPSYEILAKE